jgi:hypothetical protein
VTVPATLDRAGYDLVFEEDFTGPALAADRWVAHYLPHWSTPERSAARYQLDAGVLTLRIDADQPAWRVEDGQLRVSNIQTGSFSGPVGSPTGQHRHRLDLTVRTAQPTRRLYTPSTGMVEATLRASPDPTCMLAFWLIGFEEAAGDQSGEICVAELYGNAIGQGAPACEPGSRPTMTRACVTTWPTSCSMWTPPPGTPTPPSGPGNACASSSTTGRSAASTRASTIRCR